jgi:hypothetical protein
MKLGAFQAPGPPRVARNRPGAAGTVLRVAPWARYTAASLASSANVRTTTSAPCPPGVPSGA